MFATGSRIGSTRAGVLVLAWALLTVCLPVWADEAFTSVVTGERADHRGSYVAATLEVKPWFDSFVKPAAK